jgi:GNAT superfamily N-acetyltransferase
MLPVARFHMDFGIPPAPLTIGRLAAQDRAAWERLWRDYMTFYQRSLTDAEYDRAWAAFMADERVHALGAWDDGRLVGITHFLIHANISGDDVCYLQDLVTDTTARQRGVGRALIAAVTELARARECLQVYWMTHETNATARRLYDQVAVNRGFIRYEIALGD